ncbi:hypothetical protein B296_00020952 [Ensete ventricosum]|uniref:Uncharacterized protein n=1 Tax=Ensete ventricosum TaxID=4639 RepID=A0A426YEJ4_ENSVE|nr:hypothetical protein B296_00020952 [Ensete ventricosum]
MRSPARGCVPPTVGMRLLPLVREAAACAATTIAISRSWQTYVRLLLDVVAAYVREVVKESGKRKGEGMDPDGGVVAVVGEAAGAEGAISAVETVTRSWGNLHGGCSGRTSPSASTAATAANSCHPLVLH